MSGETGSLAGKRIVLGVTGGIAAYKSIEVCRRLVDLGAHVIPVLTDAALNMVGPTTFTALASEPPKTSLWKDSNPIPHTTMGQTCDAIVVAPATARIISDYRTGRSGDLLSATLIATEAPVILCPAMHTEMWAHPAVQDNIAVLTERGTIIVNPEPGRLAGGDIGHGRLAAPATIVDHVVDGLSTDALTGIGAVGSLQGRRIVVTAGGTREAIDPVRFIGNRSTGKQGLELAKVAHRRGAQVTLITTISSHSAEAPPEIDVVPVITAAEMEAAATDAAAGADVVIMAAAVADFRPAATADHKIKKGDGVPQVVLEPTNDILAGLGASKPAGQVLVGFAAETDDLIENAAGKLKRKNADFIVANDVSAPGVGFGHDTNAVTILGSDGSSVVVDLVSKTTIAAAVLDTVTNALSPSSSNPAIKQQ